MDASASQFVDQILLEDVNDVLNAIYNAVRGIQPDDTASHQFEADKIFVRTMSQTAKAEKLSRRRLPPNLAKQLKRRPSGYKFYSLESEAAKKIFKELQEQISGENAHDVAVFLGQVAGIYALSCPVQRYIEWERFMEGLIDGTTIALAISIYLSKSIYY